MTAPLTAYQRKANLASNRYRLIARALPIGIAVLVLRLIFHTVFSADGLVTFGDTGGIITGATIVVGLMLAGVIGDYKESEKIPAVVGGALTGLNSLANAGLEVKGLEHDWVRPRVAAVADAVLAWLRRDITDEQMFAAHADMGQLIIDVEKAGAPAHYVGRMLAVNAELGSSLSRIATIRNTDFIRAGYVLMQIMVGIVLLLLVIIDFTSPVMKWVVPGVLGMAYSYLILLVRDVDDPFSGAACVDLSPIDNAAKSLS